MITLWVLMSHYHCLTSVSQNSKGLPGKQNGDVGDVWCIYFEIETERANLVQPYGRMV